jgi:chorismate mutase
MKISPWLRDFSGAKHPFIIAGPCSAESEEQLFTLAQALKLLGITTMRAGVWKPRTRPDTFEGMGPKAFDWIASVKASTGMRFATEVATAEHVELALKGGIDILWLGARTTVNPFTVQEIADALTGVNIPVLVKNPINPEEGLWLGAIERIHKAGVERVGALHRGFSSYQKSRYRNQPYWQIPLSLKSQFPDMPLLADPSHIAGNRELIFEVSQKAMDLGYDGLMIETHPNPDQAMSDAQQQITPDSLRALLAQLRVRSLSSTDAFFINQLEVLRHQIDSLDQELIDTLSARMNLVNHIGAYKRDNNVTIFQLERWLQIMQTRSEWGDKQQLSKEFIAEIFKSIHDESIRLQTDLVTKEPRPSNDAS